MFDRRAAFLCIALALAGPLPVASTPLLEASVTVRNGSGVNPLCYSSLTDPELGTDWRSVVDTSSEPDAFLTFIAGCQGTLPGTLIPAGELLVDVAGGVLLTRYRVVIGTSSGHEEHVPADVALTGFTLSVQAVILRSPGTGARLCNALDLVLGT